MDLESNTFGPPVKSFHYAQLSSHVTTNGKDKPLAPKPGNAPQHKPIHRPVDLEKCTLYELTQYRCPEPPRVKKGETPNDVICTPFLRLFRRFVYL
jgi:Mitochondrial export protein Som1